MRERYTASAAVYDTIYGAMVDYATVADRITELVEARAPDAQTLFEIACGTGLYLEQLGRRFEVTGSDLSPEMLEVARRRVPDTPLHEGDMRTMDLGHTFDVVACLGSSIAYLLTIEDLQAACRTFARHLADGGVVVVEPWLTADTWIDDHVGMDSAEHNAVKVARMTRGRRDGNAVVVEMHHMVGVPGQPIDYFIEEHATRFFTVDQHLAAFAAAGLTAEYLPDEGGLGRGLYVAIR